MADFHPVPLPNVRVLQQMLNANAMQLCAGAVGKGIAPEDLTRVLREAYPNALPQSIAAMFRYYQRATAAGVAAREGPANQPISRPGGPANANIGSKIRYGVQMVYHAVGGAIKRLWHYVFSDIPLTPNQISDQTIADLTTEALFGQVNMRQLGIARTDVMDVVVKEVERGAGR